MAHSVANLMGDPYFILYGFCNLSSIFPIVLNCDWLYKPRRLGPLVKDRTYIRERQEALHLIKKTTIAKKERRTKIEERMEIQVVRIATKIAGYAVASVGEWLCYSFPYNDNIENMKNEGEQLHSVKNRVQHSVEAAIRNVEEIEDDVNLWLTKADVITGKFKKVLEGDEEAQRRCLYGACVNLKLRHQLSHKAKKIAQEIGGLLESGRLIKKVSCRPAPQVIMTTTNPDFVTLESRVSTTQGLIDALGDININMIGVWGMAGVGKTTLVREVARQAREGKLFDEVAIVVVAQRPDLKEIQQEIAEILGLNLLEESVSVRASLLRQRLKQDKSKKLLVLDDIWDTLDLENVGIPSEGCTLILTSRNRDVLVCGMSTQKDFGLGVLSEEEAWSLFEKMGAVGDSVKDPNIRSTATEIAKECAGLPIALVTVSRALKNKSLNEWKDALVQLRRPVPGNLTQMLAFVYKLTELSYKHLGCAEDKSVFLLCAHMGYISCYGDLLKYCYGLGFFRGIKTLDDARKRLHGILRTQDSCLLQDIPYDFERFRLRDIVLDVARYIASELDHNMLVMGDDGGLHAWPDVDALQRCEALSVLGGDIRELPEGMQCPKLKFFYINGGHLGALQIPSLSSKIHIPDASVLPRDLTFEKLERYEIVVGDVWDWSDKHETSRTLKLKLKTSIQAEVEVQKLLKKSERLFIDDTVYELEETEKGLYRNNSIIKLQLLFNEGGAFPELEDLTLELNRAVWPGQFLEELFAN
ncbi:hypothetical protein CJ030_MR8G020188 [Morella rubra]|uniref:AAA+ ATPase domain-containing protein n=1 Tax=Morella rubra TaxID=262757 RepID=A0A6A1UQ43_9ROSI|nr:hypothetical protein CJ030_MR8G020188 [Morella rubra]